MVGDAEVAADDLRHARGGPQVVGPAVGGGAVEQQVL
jgi:hypothetical protein